MNRRMFAAGLCMTIAVGGCGSEPAAMGTNEGVGAPPVFGDAGGGAAGSVIPTNAQMLVGRWSMRPDCAEVTEFFADGRSVNSRGQPQTWSAVGMPPVVTVNAGGISMSGRLEATAQGIRITGSQPGQVADYYRCGAGPAASGPVGGIAQPASPLPSADAAISPPRQTSGSLSAADYPAAAIRAGASGTTRVTLQIDAAGQAGDCTVTASSGSSILDATTCSLMQRRFRFLPATRGGQAVAGTIEREMTWTLPND